MFGQGSVQRRRVPLTLLTVGAAAVVVALLATQRGGGAAAPGPSGAGGSPGSPASPASATSPAAASISAALPDGLADSGWIAEIGVQRWAAGSLTGRVVLLPHDEIALTATADRVVSVRYGPGGRSSTVRVRPLTGKRLQASARQGTVGSAVVVGDTVYVTGDDGTGGGSDAGVQAISLADGSVHDVIPAGPSPADSTGPVSRSQLRLDPSGMILGSALCAGDRCTVDFVNLASGLRTTPVRNGHGFLVALTDRVLYLANDTVTTLDALDAVTGDSRWHLADVQLSGVLPTSDGSRVVLSYLARKPAGSLVFTLASADAATGAIRVLLERPAETDVPTFYPNLSGDRFAVISDGGTLGDWLGGSRGRAALTLVDMRSGAISANAVSIAAP